MIHTYLECKYRINVYGIFSIKLVVNCGHPKIIGYNCCKRLCRTKKCLVGYQI